MTDTPARPLSVALIGYLHGRGGIQTHSRYLAEGLRQRGHSVQLISPPPMAQHGHVNEADGAEVYSGLLDLIRLLRQAQPDVAMVTGTGWKSMLGALAAGRGSRKVFFEVMSGARLSWADPRALVKLGFDSIVGQGAPVTKRFVREFAWRGPTDTIPALPEPLERKFSIAAREIGPIERALRFVYFGRLAPPKNVGLLVEEFDRFAPPESTLDIWGGGADEQRIQRLIAERGLDERIAMRGRYPDGQAYIDLLQAYDLLLLPTVAEEGAPLVLLEAMACGLPFVANGMGGIPDYANPDSSITSGNIDGFVPAVLTMVERLRAGDVSAHRLQQRYHSHFSFERLVDRWEAYLLGL